MVDNLKYIRPEMKVWNSINFEPVNYEVTVFKKQRADAKIAERK